MSAAPGPDPSARDALPIHCMVAVGGLAALSWETIWQLQASLALGVSALGAALTLAATMAGMTAGALAMGAWLDRREVERPLRLYGLLEGVIGAAGLLMLPGFRALESLDGAVYAAAPALAAPLHGLGVGLLLAPATCAMGASVPVFQLIARRHGSSISRLYATNTAGAALGVLLMTFAVLPALGVFRTCLLLAALNFAVFALAVLWKPGVASSPARQSAEVPSYWPSPIPLRVALIAVTCTGFATFGLEVAWFRALRSAFWSTSSTFAMMLAAVLISLALGARLVPWLQRRGRTPPELLAAAGALILITTPLVERMDLAIKLDGPYFVVLAVWFGLSLLAIGPAVICLATVLPWCLEDHRDPRATGRLYGLNALGAVAGLMVAAWGLLPWAGFAVSAWLLGLLVLACAAWASPPAQRANVVIAAGMCLLIAALGSSSPGRDRLQNELDYQGHKVLAFEEGADFTTSVVETPEGVRHLLIDGFVATSDHRVGSSYMYWMGSLPALLHAKPETGLVIAFGTGQTANGLRREGLQQIDVVDVSQSVFELAPFFEANEGVLQEPTVRAITMDGRAWLRRSQQRYDVITLEPMPPNFSGVNALYSQEFYEIAAARLNRNGVIAQWLPIHMLSPEHATSIAAAFVSVFPDALLWFDPSGGTGVLLGRRRGALSPLGESWPGLRRDPVERPLQPRAIRRSVWLDQQRLALYARGGSVITDDNQLLQWGQLKPAPTSQRAHALNQENATILARFAGRPPFTLGNRSSERSLRPEAR